MWKDVVKLHKKFREKDVRKNENAVFGVFAPSERKTKQWNSTKEFCSAGEREETIKKLDSKNKY